MIKHYLYSITGDSEASENFVDTLKQLNIPIQTFSTAIKLYKKLKAGNQTYKTGQKIIYQMKGEASESFYCKTDSKQKREPKNAPMANNTSLKYTDLIFLKGILSNSYLLLVTCCVIAYKYHKDVPYTNEAWASATHMDFKYLSKVERQVLLLLGHKVGFPGEEKILSELGPYLLDEYQITWSSPITKIAKKNKCGLRRLFCLT